MRLKQLNKSLRGSLLLTGVLSAAALSPLVTQVVVASTHQSSSYTETSELLTDNPGRGLYTPKDHANTILATEESEFIIPDGTEVNIVRYLLDLSDSCNSTDISDKETELSNVLDHLSSLGKRALLRIIYTPLDGTVNACGHYYPESLDIVSDHLTKLAAIVNVIPESVAFIEAGIIGPWGEWHGWGADGELSEYDMLTTKSNRNFIVSTLRSSFHSEIPVLVRRPVFKLESYDWVKQSASVGFHNDCFLTTKSDVEIDKYTFSSGFDAYTYGYDTLDELFGYAKTQSSSVAMGGETCTSTENRFSCSEALAEIEELHYDYLNGGFYDVAIQTWIDGGCFDEIKSRLGYRFHLENTWSTTDVRPSEVVTISLNISNKGFGKLLRSNKVELGLSKDGQWYGVGVDLTTVHERGTTLNTIGAGKTQETVISFNAPTEVGSYEVYLMLNDPTNSDGKHAIQLASQDGTGNSIWDETLMAHKIGVAITVISE